MLAAQTRKPEIRLKAPLLKKFAHPIEERWAGFPLPAPPPCLDTAVVALQARHPGKLHNTLFCIFSTWQSESPRSHCHRSTCCEEGLGCLSRGCLPSKRPWREPSPALAPPLHDSSNWQRWISKSQPGPPSTTWWDGLLQPGTLLGSQTNSAPPVAGGTLGHQPPEHQHDDDLHLGEEKGGGDDQVRLVHEDGRGPTRKGDVSQVASHLNLNLRFSDFKNTGCPWKFSIHWS